MIFGDREREIEREILFYFFRCIGDSEIKGQGQNQKFLFGGVKAKLSY